MERRHLIEGEACLRKTFFNSRTRSNHRCWIRDVPMFKSMQHNFNSSNTEEASGKGEKTLKKSGLCVSGVIYYWCYLLVVLFVSGVICNGYNQPVSSAEGEEGADISCHCKALHSAAQNSCTADISCHSSCIEAARETCIDANAVGFKMLCRCRRAAAFKSALFKFLLCAMMNGTSWSMRSCSALDALLHCLTIAPLNYCNVILWPKNLYSGE